MENGNTCTQTTINIVWTGVQAFQYLHFDPWGRVPHTFPCGQVGIHVLFAAGFDDLHPFPSTTHRYHSINITEKYKHNISWISIRYYRIKNKNISIKSQQLRTHIDIKNIYSISEEQLIT